MKKKYSHRFYKYLLLVNISLFAIKSYAQTFGDKTHYLVDSLNIERLSNSEIKLIDSALTIYYQSKHDTLKVEAINIIVEESWNDDVWPKYNDWVYNFTIEKLANNVINKTKNAQVKKFLLKNQSGALNNYGVLYFTQRNYVQAIESYLKSLAIKEAINDQKGIASIYNNIGSIHDQKGNSSKALSYYLKSLKIRETLNDKKGLSISLNNVGQIYYNQGDIDKALHYFQKSLTINPNAKNGYAKAAILNNIGIIYQKNNNIPLALKYFNESMVIKEEIGDKKGIVISLNSIGGVYRDQQKYKQAFEYFKNSLTLSKEINNKEGLAISLNNSGIVYFITGKLTKAKSNCQESLSIAEELKNPALIRDATLILTKIYKKENNWKEALKMHELYLLMRDSVSNKEIEKDVIRQKATYDLDIKEQEITLLSTKNEVQELKLIKNRALIALFAIAFGLVTILVLLVFRGNKKKKVIYKLLKKQKEDITKKNEEKTVLLKEIHHRVKNNLQVVNSLLKFQSREIEDEKIIDMFNKAQKRVLSMAMLHEKLYRSDDLKNINIKDHLTVLIEDLIKNYAVDKIITLEIEIDEISNIGIETLTSLGLIISELITNSLKHAFINKNDGTVMVSLKQLSMKYVLIIGDNGVGFVPKKESGGLGTKLTQIFTKQLGGTITKLNESGTVFKIEFEKLSR